MTFRPPANRAILIRSQMPAAENPDHDFGTGYLVGPGKIVTALHVVTKATTVPIEALAVEVCRPALRFGRNLWAAENWATARLIWPPAGHDATGCDIAVLQVDNGARHEFFRDIDDEEKQYGVHPLPIVQAARLERYQSVEVTGYGFPRPSLSTGTDKIFVTESADVSGDLTNELIYPQGGGAKVRLSYTLQSEGTTDDTSYNAWAGASGALLHLEGSSPEAAKAVAILCRASTRNRHQLYAVPLSRAGDQKLPPESSFWTASGMAEPGPIPAADFPALIRQKSSQRQAVDRLPHLIDQSGQVMRVLKRTDHQRNSGANLRPTFFLGSFRSGSDRVDLFHARIGHELRVKYEGWPEVDDLASHTRYRDAFTIEIDEEGSKEETVERGVQTLVDACLTNICRNGNADPIIDPLGKHLGFCKLPKGFSIDCLTRIIETATPRLAFVPADSNAAPIVVLFMLPHDQTLPDSVAPLQGLPAFENIDGTDLTAFVNRANRLLANARLQLAIDELRLRQQIQQNTNNTALWTMDQFHTAFSQYAQQL
ncbi:serine protease [Boseaceae bacterium BT-24-1]|nr:serine protease [Boseaceae bacterium BT-24-1]